MKKKKLAILELFDSKSRYLGQRISAFIKKKKLNWICAYELTIEVKTSDSLNKVKQNLRRKVFMELFIN